MTLSKDQVPLINDNYSSFLYDLLIKFEQPQANALIQPSFDLDVFVKLLKIFLETLAIK
jgi:hypothetical protein